MGRRRSLTSDGPQPSAGYEGWRPGLFAKDIPTEKVEELDARRMWTEYIAQRRPVWAELLNNMCLINKHMFDVGLMNDENLPASTASTLLPCLHHYAGQDHWSPLGCGMEVLGFAESLVVL
jgi:hypothetical protein